MTLRPFAGSKTPADQSLSPLKADLEISRGRSHSAFQVAALLLGEDFERLVLLEETTLHFSMGLPHKFGRGRGVVFE